MEHRSAPNKAFITSFHVSWNCLKGGVKKWKIQKLEMMFSKYHLRVEHIHGNQSLAAVEDTGSGSV